VRVRLEIVGELAGRVIKNSQRLSAAQFNMYGFMYKGAPRWTSIRCACDLRFGGLNVRLPLVVDLNCQLATIEVLVRDDR
jgi:hypothetical protein